MRIYFPPALDNSLIKPYHSIDIMTAMPSNLNVTKERERERAEGDVIEDT